MAELAKYLEEKYPIKEKPKTAKFSRVPTIQRQVPRLSGKTPITLEDIIGLPTQDTEHPTFTKFEKAIYSREHKGLNTIILVLGTRGIGKTWESLQIAQRLSRRLHKRKFSCKDVFFTARQLMGRLRYYNNRGDKWRWLVFDETVLEASAREFMSKRNRVMSHVCESFRKTHVNLIIISLFPRLVDINIREMADFWIVMQGRAKCRVYKVKQKIFREGVQTHKYCLIEGGVCSRDLALDYEVKRKEYLDGKYEEWEKVIENYELALQPKDLSKQIAAMQEVKQLYVDGKIGKMDIAPEVRERLGVNRSYAFDFRRRILKEVEMERRQHEVQSEG